MPFIAFTPAALLRFIAIAVQRRLTEDETCAIVRGLRVAHPHGIVSVEAVEQPAGDVLVHAVTDALAARAAHTAPARATVGD